MDGSLRPQWGIVSSPIRPTLCMMSASAALAVGETGGTSKAEVFANSRFFTLLLVWVFLFCLNVPRGCCSAGVCIGEDCWSVGITGVSTTFGVEAWGETSFCRRGTLYVYLQ